MISSFFLEMSSLLGHSGFWHEALPVGVCSVGCNDNNMDNNNDDYYNNNNNNNSNDNDNH